MYAALRKDGVICSGRAGARAQSVHRGKALKNKRLELGPGVAAVFHSQEFFPVLQWKNNPAGLQKFAHLGQGAQGVGQGFEVQVFIALGRCKPRGQKLQLRLHPAGEFRKASGSGMQLAAKLQGFFPVISVRKQWRSFTQAAARASRQSPRRSFGAGFG